MVLCGPYLASGESQPSGAAAHVGHPVPVVDLPTALHSDRRTNETALSPAPAGPAPAGPGPAGDVRADSQVPADNPVPTSEPVSMPGRVAGSQEKIATDASQSPVSGEQAFNNESSPAQGSPGASQVADATAPPTSPNVSLAAPVVSSGHNKADEANVPNSAREPVNLHPPGRFTPAEPFDPSPATLLKPDPAPPLPAPLAPVAPLAILKMEVAPGTASRLAWSPEDSFSGIATGTPVLVVHGAKPGPKVCLSAAIHGDEVNGIEVVRHILYSLDPNQLAGTVIGVPIVNMQGFRRNSRYLSDRRDLNRFFPGRAQGSAAARIAYSFFNEVAVHCNYLVDIHTGSFGRTNLPQLRADLTKPAVIELAQNLGDIAVLHNKGAKGSLRRAAQDRGIPAVTLEAGEPHTFQEPAIAQSVKSIEQLLFKLHMYNFSGLNPRRIDAVFYKAQWLRTKGGGMLFNKVALGQEVTSGQLLGTVTDPITNQRIDIHAPRDGLIIGMALNQVMQPGFAAYHLGYPATLLEAAQSDAGPEDFGADASASDSGDF